MEIADAFEGPAETEAADADVRFVVDVEGYEGPLDVLLALARDQKVDLTQISILELADQYLAFVARVRRANLEIAADYLVMAAWLAYLKSRLLLPAAEGEEEPTGEAMAAALAFHLRRLEAMRESGLRLMARPRLGRDFFSRGEPERYVTTSRTVYAVTLFELLKAYGDQRRRVESQTLRIEPTEYFSVEDALRRMRGLLGTISDWESLWRFLPAHLAEGLPARSAYASTFVAGLELVREGRLRLRQNSLFGPIYLRPADGRPGEPDIGGGEER